MGMRFRKSINLGGGTKLNISKSGVGVSTGVKGFRKSVNTSGRTRTTVSVPGTGISYVKESNTNGKNNANSGVNVKAGRKNNGTWKLVVGILLAIGGITLIGEEIGAAIFGIVAGAALVFWWVKSKKKASETNYEHEGPIVEQDGIEKKEEYYIHGTYYHENEIMHLAKENADWNKSIEELTENGVIPRRVYRYKFKNKPVKLVPDPTNEHDPNAVKVIIAGEFVGYIPAEDAAHVKYVIESRTVKYISAFIGGGEYKNVYETEEFKSSDNFSISVRITYV